MNALPLINLEVLRIPTYRNERVRSFGLWYRDNEPTLTEYYSQLQRFGGEGEPIPDFFEFAAIQHERQEVTSLRTVTECSICRREHGPEVVHACE